MNLKYSLISAAFAVLLCLLSGCAGQQMSRRSMVTALELEALPQGWRLTVEYLKRTSADEAQSYGTYQGEGRTYLEAIQKIEAKAGDSLYLDSTKCLILAGVEKKGELEGILLEIDRDGRVRPHVLVVLGSGLLEKKESEAFSVGLQTAELLSGGLEGYAVSVKDAINSLTAAGRGGMLPSIALEEEGCRLVGFGLMGEDALAFVERAVGQSLPVRFLHREEFILTGAVPGLCDIQLEKTGISVRCRMSGGRPRFTITASAGGYIRAASHTGAAANPQYLDRTSRELEEILREEFEKIMENTVKATGTDLFSLGKICSFRYPNQWKYMGEDWARYLQNLEYEIVVKVKIEDKCQVLGG